MKILAIDVGTGTQDVLLFDSRIDVENNYKMVLPSPTMMTNRHLKAATKRGQDVVLTGVTMGGGPSNWAAEDHLKAGYAVYATPEAARTFNDDLNAVRDLGIILVSEDEVDALPADVVRVNLQDFDLPALSEAFSIFGVDLGEVDAVAVAVFDHGAAPPGYSDRQFRFDYIAERMQISRTLGSFAFMRDEVPASMTRMQAVGKSAGALDSPLILMDTAPAAVLGAMYDPVVHAQEHFLMTNIGNFHTIAFRMGPKGIEGVFEHHTGFLNTRKLENFLGEVAGGTLTHETIFSDQGHGALLLTEASLDLQKGAFDIAVTGPRWAMMKNSNLRVHFATPFGDMMLAGCYGLVRAVGDKLPEIRDEITAALDQSREKPPWEL
ncbi:DUF1786 domain-containing protein [bacterium]|nr:DUF1786 domain-containing protein [bacterium]